MEVKKAIIPAAGLGTRFLPATKSIPKEMLPLLDKPAIQYVVEEGAKSGIKNFVIVDNKYKKSIEDHFDSFFELDNYLANCSKQEALNSINKIMKSIDFSFVRQREPLGLGHAILAAKHAVGKEHVAVMLPDDIIMGVNPAISQLVKIASQEKCNVVAVQEIPLEHSSRYGIVAIKKQFSPNLFQVKELVEKPSPTEAPSNLAIVGRYVLSPNIFNMLEEVQPGKLGEIQLTDGIQKLLSFGEKVFAYKISGARYDTGTPFGWLKANIELSLTHPEYSEQMLNYIKGLDSELLIMQNNSELLYRKEREV